MNFPRLIYRGEYSHDQLTVGLYHMKLIHLLSKLAVSTFNAFPVITTTYSIYLEAQYSAYSIMATFTSQEYADIHFYYGKANGNAYEAQRLYKTAFCGPERPVRNQRRLPDPRVFSGVHNRISLTGSVFTETRERGATRFQDERDEVELEERIIDLVRRNPEISIRDISLRTGCSRWFIWKVITDECLHPYHFTKVQQLLPEDYGRREEYCEWLLQNRDLNRYILWTDEAKFTRHGYSNPHNDHLWAAKNPHATISSSFQERFSVNVWAGVVNNRFVGPFIFEQSINSQRYLDFLRNHLDRLFNESMGVADAEDLPLDLRQNFHYMHDGAPAHRTQAVTEFLNTKFGGKWLGFNSPYRPWPARSPDLTVMDFSVWSYLKSLVYRNDIQSRGQLLDEINNACNALRADENMLSRMTNEAIHRAELCLDNFGGHFENYL